MRNDLGIYKLVSNVAGLSGGANGKGNMCVLIGIVTLHLYVQPDKFANFATALVKHVMKSDSIARNFPFHWTLHS